MHQGIAHRVACVVAGPSDADEAVQTGFFKAWAAIGRFRPGAPFRPWLLAIVANEARNVRRSAGRREGLALRLREDRRPADAAPSPESAVLARDEAQRAVDELAELSEADREILSCRFLLEMSEAETAAALGVRLGTVKSRTARALERLRDRMAER